MLSAAFSENRAKAFLVIAEFPAVFSGKFPQFRLSFVEIVGPDSIQVRFIDRAMWLRLKRSRNTLNQALHRARLENKRAGYQLKCWRCCI